MRSVTITIHDKSSGLETAELRRWLPALQTQITRDFAPVWGIDARLRLAQEGEARRPADWEVFIVDDSATAGGFLGVHRARARRTPVSYVLVSKALEAGEPVSLVLSHELLEMLADPDVNQTHWVERAGNAPLLYAREVCDPCQGAQYAYEIAGVVVSDFIYPAWFEEFWPRGTRFDVCDYIKRPYQILPDGYMSVCRVDSRPAWTEIDNRNRARSLRRRGQPGSRRHRRASR